MIGLQNEGKRPTKPKVKLPKTAETVSKKSVPLLLGRFQTGLQPGLKPQDLPLPYDRNRSKPRENSAAPLAHPQAGRQLATGLGNKCTKDK